MCVVTPSVTVVCGGGCVVLCVSCVLMCAVTPSLTVGMQLTKSFYFICAHHAVMRNPKTLCGRGPGTVLDLTWIWNCQSEYRVKEAR